MNNTSSSDNSYKYDRLNEEFINLKKIFNKIGLGLSKMFGDAKEANELIEKHKKEILLDHKKIKAWIRSLSIIKDFINKSESAQKQAQNQNKAQNGNKNLDKILTAPTSMSDDEIENVISLLIPGKRKEAIKLIGKKLNLMINQIPEKRKLMNEVLFKKLDKLSDTKNEEIKFYVEIKKSELKLDLLKMEIEIIAGEVEDFSKIAEWNEDEYLSEVKSSLEATSSKLSSDKKEEETNKSKIEIKVKEIEKTKLLKSGEESKNKDVKTFNFEEARKDPMEYKWEDSPFLDKEFKTDEEIKIWQNKSKYDIDTYETLGNKYKGTTVWISNEENRESMSEEEKKDKIMVVPFKGDYDKSYSVFRSKIISTKESESAENKEKTESQGKTQGEEKGKEKKEEGQRARAQA